LSGETSYPLQYKVIPWMIVIIISIILAILMLKKNKSIVKDYKVHRQYNLVFAIFLCGFSLIRIFYLFSDFERVAHGKTILHYLFVYTSHIIIYFILTVLMYYFDKNIVHSKNLFIVKFSFLYFIISVIFVLLSLSFEQMFDILRLFLFPGMYVIFGIVAILILKMLLKIHLSASKNILYFGMGIFIGGMAQILDSDFLYGLIYINNPVFLVIPPILTLIGFIIAFKYSNDAFKIIIEFYTTKQMCLVHRGISTGKIAYCPNCYIKYCKNCFDSVIKIENKCWVCDYIFDQNINTELETIEPEIIDDKKIANQKREVGKEEKSIKKLR